MAISFMAFTAEPSSAAYKFYNEYKFTTGTIKDGKTNHTAKVYRDSSWFRVYHGTLATSSGFEYKNNTKIVLSQTKSFTLGAQTKGTLNGSLNFTPFNIPTKVGGSIEKTASASWGIANTTTRTIDAKAPKGYYSYNVCLNTHKVKVDRYTGSKIDRTITFFAPRSEAYRSIVYNKNNANYSGVSRF